MSTTPNPGAPILSPRSVSLVAAVLLLAACSPQSTGSTDGGGDPEAAGVTPDDAGTTPDDAGTDSTDGAASDDGGLSDDGGEVVSDDAGTDSTDGGPSDDGGEVVSDDADSTDDGASDDGGEVVSDDAGATDDGASDDGGEVMPDEAGTTPDGAGTIPDDGGVTTTDGGASNEGDQVTPDEGARGSVDGGFAILGDSNSDEYRADDDRGRGYASVTFNWMELLVRARGLDFGAWGTWGDARRTGFEHNWARTGARAADLVGQGQAAGVAQQVEDGAVRYVYVHIGSNDFHLLNGSYREIYDGSLTDSQVAAKVAKVVSDVTAAVDVVLAASPERIVVTLFGDPGLNPRALATYPSEAGRDRVSAAIASVNEGLTQMAATRPRVTLYDLNEFASSVVGRLDANGNLDVGGELISMVEAGDEPHHVQLGDSAGHLGTVASGLFANATFIGPFNEAELLDIPMLTDAEILSHAGL